MSMTLSSSSALAFDKQSMCPRANVFLLVNLGCEMLYVVDQRLKAQHIADDKSIQVIHDITTVLLEPKFLDSIIIGSTHTNAQLLTAEHCKFMLKDIATCSLMRLDGQSMDKLWNLMTVIYKWQLFVSKHQHHLLDITFRHLNTIGNIYPDAKRNMLIDFTKNTLLDFWNSFNDDEQLSIYRTNIAWLQCFDTKISVLIRLGFQKLDGSFPSDVRCDHFQEFVETIGENIYVKSAQVLARQRLDLSGSSGASAIQSPAHYDVNQLAEIFSAQTNEKDEDLKPIDVNNFQQQFERNLQQCNLLFEDLDVNSTKSNKGIPSASQMSNDLILDMHLFPDSTSHQSSSEFVQMKPVYNRNPDVVPSGTNNTIGLTKDLLDFYRKMN